MISGIKKRMMNMATQGGSHDQHVKAGQQSHKNTDSTKDSGWQQTTQQNATGRNDQNSNSQTSSATRGGTHEQHVKAGQQSHKNSR